MIITPLLYLANNLCFKKITTGNFHTFMNGYFNDLICPFFLLSYANILLLCVGNELRKLHWILLFMFVAGCIWEFAAPLFKPTAVTDIWDLVCYICGGFLYWIVLTLCDRYKKRRTNT